MFLWTFFLFYEEIILEVRPSILGKPCTFWLKITFLRTKITLVFVHDESIFLRYFSKIPAPIFVFLLQESDLLQALQHIFTQSSILVMQPFSETSYCLFILLASQDELTYMNLVPAAGPVEMDFNSGTNGTNFRRIKYERNATLTS
jgi:hypothetical protein